VKDQFTVSSPNSVTRWLGSTSVRAEAGVSLCGGGLVTVGYVALASALGTSTTALEALALVFSLACVWLARRENIWNMPFGIVAVVLMGVFYFRIDLVGQAWLQFAYYIPIQMLGWWAWTHGGERNPSLPVTRLNKLGWAVTLAFGSVVWAACWTVFAAIYDQPMYLGWDTSIVASSIVAQTLMTWKKMENWLFWTIPVNVSSIFLYLVTHAWAFAFLYTVFLANSVWAWRQWASSAQARCPPVPPLR